MNTSTDTIIRCNWAQSDPLNLEYHDTQWGVPVHDDTMLFEMLVLEGVQAGLSWTTVLKKREHYKKVFDEFNIDKISNYSQTKIDALLSDPGIIRNKLKIHSAIQNAKAFKKIQKEYGSFDAYIWGFVGNKTLKHTFKTMGDYPTTITESETMSRDLKKGGFNFVGPTICYAFMQACGLVNDHLVQCFRYEKV